MDIKVKLNAMRYTTDGTIILEGVEEVILTDMKNCIAIPEEKQAHTQDQSGWIYLTQYDTESVLAGMEKLGRRCPRRN